MDEQSGAPVVQLSPGLKTIAIDPAMFKLSEQIIEQQRKANKFAVEMYRSMRRQQYKRGIIWRPL